MNNNQLKKSIISTIVFFDIFNYPLTLEEVFYFLYLYKSDKKNDLRKIKKILKKDIINSINSKNGFYFLKGREEIIKIREKREVNNIDKIKRAKKISKIFSFIKSIKMIALVNFIPVKNTRKKSDIDLFIITKKDRIWITRFLCVIILKILKLQPTKKNKINKICLTFFITEDNLNLKKIAIKNDIYFYYWLSNIYPIYTKGDIYSRFIKKNRWVKEFLPNIKIDYKQPREEKGILIRFFTIKRFKGQYNAFKKTVVSYLKFLKKHINKIEKITMSIQVKKMSNKIKSMANENTDVIINNKMLKFHDNDMRRVYKREFFEKIKKYENK